MGKTIVATLLFFFLGYSICNSQVGNVIDRAKYERKKPKIKKSKSKTLVLAQSITRNSKTDIEKATAIYRWIASNIAYDNELMRNVKLQKEIYTSTDNIIEKALQRKMALCGGFAFLYQDLCKNVGITSEVIHGYTKSYTGKPKDRKPAHTWNVVKLNGKWEFLDITWAISHGSNNKPDDFWFLTKPQEFIFSHYPEDSKWTLVSNPITLAEFQKI